MNRHILLSFGFLFFNQINGMLLQSKHNIKDSSLLSFQKEAEQNKQYVLQEIQKTLTIEKKAYQHALALDNNQPAEYVARWYKKYRFPEEITDQTIEQASLNFKKHSLKGQQAVIKYSENQQELLRTLLLPQEIQYILLTHLLAGCNTPSAVEKFQKLPLKKAYETLAESKEWFEKNPNSRLSIGDWFLLDPDHYETVHNILSSKNNSYTIESSQELAIIRSLPANIKTSLSSNQCKRNYKWHEKLNHIVQDTRKGSPPLKYLMILPTEFTIFPFLGLLRDGIDFKKAIIKSSFLGCSAGLVTDLAIFTYCPLKDIHEKSPLWTILISAISSLSFYYGSLHNNTIPFLFARNCSLGTLVGSSVMSIIDKYCKPYKPKQLKVTKPLDQI